MTVADYVNDLVLLKNTPAQAESLLHSLELATRDTVPVVNSNETYFMCFKQEGSISTLSSKPLKLVDSFTYLGSSVPSNERDFTMRIEIALSAIDRLSII